MLRLLALILCLTATAAFAQDIMLDDSFPGVTRKTGGAKYVIPITGPVKKLTIDLSAVLVNPRLAAHKIRIHDVSIRVANGAVLSMHQGGILTGAASKLTVSINSAALISEVIVQAESFAALQRLDVAVKGTTFVDEEAIRRQAEEEARRRAEEEARRIAEEARRAEEARQQQCSATLLPTQQQLSRCEDELKIALRQLNRTQLDIQLQEGRMSALEVPIQACLSETSKYEIALQETQDRLEQQRKAFNAIKEQVAQTLSAHDATVNYPPVWECVMSDVGHRSFWRSGTGRYVGRGSTPARALEAAMKKCPGSEADGCGEHEDLKAMVECRPLNDQKESL